MSFHLFFFFFSSRRRHTRWNCDWSSDVCSSDLAGPLQSILPTIDMSEPMQEAVPIVGSDLAQAWSCGCTTLPMTSGAFAAAFLSFSVALLFILFNMSTSFFPQYEVRCESGRLFDAAPTLPCLERRGPQ